MSNNLPAFLRTIEDLETEDLDDHDLKRYALAEYLERDPDDITGGYQDNDFVVDSRNKRMGEPASYFVKLAGEIRQILSRNNRLEQTWQGVIDQFSEEYDQMIDDKMATSEESDSDRDDGVQISEDTRRYFLIEKYNRGLFAYNKLKGFMPDAAMHYYVNGLYHLLCGPAGGHETSRTWHIYAIRVAFNGEEIKEGRPFSNVNDGEYIILTEEQVDQQVKEYIEGSVWAFNAHFLSGETGLDSDVFEKLSVSCEDANDAILSIIKGSCGLDDFVDAAISADGRGHFLSGYDGEETEIKDLEGNDLLVYRTN